MHSSPSTNRSLPSSIILLITFFLLSTQVIAVPGFYEDASSVGSVLSRALGQVGPARQIERLRLRRNVQAITSSFPSDSVSPLKSKTQQSVDASPVLNPKRRSNAPILNSKRQLLTRSKLKTQQSRDSVPRAVLNPKRSLDHVDVVRRSIVNGVESVVGRQQAAKRDSSAIFAAGPGLFSFGLGPVIIPNPKSPNYPTSRSATSTISTPLSTSTVAAAASTSAAVPSSTATSWPTGPMIAAAYYPDWQGSLMPPSSVDFSLFDLIDFAFAIPTSDFNIEFTQSNSGTLLKELVSYAHGNNTKVLISIGGWTASNLFSTAVSTSANRKKFVSNIVAFAKSYDVDGVDIDWEYPGTSGAAGNAQSPDDTANFLSFLTLLRSKLGAGQRISACVSQEAFISSNGSPLADVTAFGKVLDNILVMNYDVWGASSTPGPNAPLSDACPNSNQPNANEASAIQTWTAAGMPASKILMGVPSYGYISSSTATTLVHKRSIIPGGVNNRDRARAAQAENSKSQMRRWFEKGQRLVEKRQLEAKILKRAERKLHMDSIKKRTPIISCPNNHSGKPCAGITNQTITTINWNPLSNNGTTPNRNSTPGVFPGGIGIGKLGDGSVASIVGNQIEFYQLISYGLLVKSGSSYTAVNGYTRAWDSCSSTPFLYDVSRKVVITYDDPQSMILKGQLAASNNIGGLNMWDISGDTTTWDITRAFRKGMGLVNPT